MTGHFPARYNIDGHFAWVPQNQKRNMPDWLSPQAPLLPRMLQQAGYATAHFGKWHLSNDMIPDSPLPSEYGYDQYGAFNCAGEQIPVHDDARQAEMSCEGLREHAGEQRQREGQLRIRMGQGHRASRGAEPPGSRAPGRVTCRR